MRNITGSSQVGEIVQNLKEITQHTKEVVATVQGIVGTNEGDLRNSVGSVKDSLASLNRSLARIETVTEHVEHGDGLLGKLTSDQQFAQKVGGAVVDASEYVAKLTRIQTEIMLRSELLVNERATKNYLKLRLIPKPDKYFELDVVDDPRGLLERQTVVRSPPSSVEVANQEVRTTYYNRLKFGAQFAKRYSFLTLRFGLIESTGGLGFDMHFLEDHLELSVDAFEFANPGKDYPRIKTYLNFMFLRHLFVTAGGDDIINPPEIEPTTGRILTGRDWFVGGGFYFNDEDLKALLPTLPNISL